MRHALFLTLLLTALLGDAMPAWAAEEKAASDKAANAKDWAFPKADAKDTWREVRQDSSTSICMHFISASFSFSLYFDFILV